MRSGEKLAIKWKKKRTNPNSREVLHVNKNREMFNEGKEKNRINKVIVVNLQSCSPESVWPASS